MTVVTSGRLRLYRERRRHGFTVRSEPDERYRYLRIPPLSVTVCPTLCIESAIILATLGYFSCRSYYALLTLRLDTYLMSGLWASSVRGLVFLQKNWTSWSYGRDLPTTASTWEETWSFFLQKNWTSRSYERDIPIAASLPQGKLEASCYVSSRYPVVPSDRSEGDLEDSLISQAMGSFLFVTCLQAALVDMRCTVHLSHAYLDSQGLWQGVCN